MQLLHADALITAGQPAAALPLAMRAARGAGPETNGGQAVARRALDVARRFAVFGHYSAGLDLARRAYIRGELPLEPSDVQLLYPPAFETEIATAAGLYGIPGAILNGLVREESHFRPAAESHVGARGLAQLMPATADDILRRLGGDAVDLDDPSENLRLGAFYLNYLNEQLPESAVIQIAAYNAGLGRGRRWIAEFGDLPPLLQIEALPFIETRWYVRRVTVSAAIYQWLRDGLSPEDAFRAIIEGGGMSLIQAILLGALQGATEFLPVSSSGHLVITKELFGAAHVPVLFDVLLHVATLVAVIIVLREQVGAFLGAIARVFRRAPEERDQPYLRLIPIIIVTTAITGAIGIGLDSAFDIRNPSFTSALFLFTALLLVLTRWSRGTRGFAAIRWADAAILGVAQGFGVLPGISRSGITISTALYAGMDRKTAGEYSFLLSIPAILGALVLTLRDLERWERRLTLARLSPGCVTAAVVGYVALRVLLRLVRAGRLYLFAVYLIPLGIWGLLHF